MKAKSCIYSKDTRNVWVGWNEYQNHIKCDIQENIWVVKKVKGIKGDIK